MRFNVQMTAVAVIILSGPVAAGGLDIDRFTTPQSTPPNSEIVAPEALGGARGLSNAGGISASTADGLLVITNAETESRDASLYYDGIQDDFPGNPGSLGGLDLTANGNERFAFQIEDIEGSVVIQVLFRGNMENCFVLEGVSSTGTFILPFNQTGRSDCTAAAASLDSLIISIIPDAGGSIALSTIEAIPTELIIRDGFESEQEPGKSGF